MRQNSHFAGTNGARVVVKLESWGNLLLKAFNFYSNSF
jgi:hypothetical protein